MLRKKAAGGRKVEREVEPSRILKLKECCDMLLAAGYFRARLAHLSPFDKVVGGMVWSITASGVDVGVDILFQENSTIGERIKLSENLVKALMYMKCPLPLQEHQIQGLNYDNLFPVLQWLVKRVIETRQLTGDLVRAFSVSKFDQDYKFPEEAVSFEAKNYVLGVTDVYKPGRKFKKLDNAKFDSMVQRAEATLLEYGEKMFSAVVYDEEKQDRKREREEKRSGKAGGGAKLATIEGKLVLGETKQTQKDVEELEAVRVAREQEEDRLQEVASQQLASEGAQVEVARGNVGSILTMQAAEIKKAAEEYAVAAEEAAVAGDEEHAHARAEAQLAQAFERQVETLKKKIKAEKAQGEAKLPDYQELEAKVQELKAAKAKKEVYQERIVSETAKLDVLENSTSNKDVLAKLKQLVFLNESLKQQEAQFKASCTQQRTQLMGLMQELESGSNDEETKRMKEIEALYGADLSKLNKLRGVLAKKNQEIAKVTRAIDDIPTRAELLQYERRFVELYELVQDKLVETRKYYEFYNTLNESYTFMTNEDSLLNSIIEGFPKAIKSSQKGKDAFLASLQQIIESVDKNKNHVDKDLSQEVSMRDTLNQKYTKLLEKQRKYFKAVKEFQEECYKNEKLTQTLERLR